MSLIDSVIEHEGFRSKPYKDHLGNWTFGHGLTWISEEESRVVVGGRLQEIRRSLIDIKPWLSSCHSAVRHVVIEMGYQLGVRGVLNFTKMWVALEAEDYRAAADECLDSKWAQQTPGRAKEMSDIIRGLA